MRKQSSIFIIVLAALLMVLPAACTVDPSPDAFREPVFGRVSVNEGVPGEVEFTCRVSPMSQVADCGLYYRVAGDEAGWLKTPGVPAGADAFKVRLDNLAGGTSYSCRMYVGNGRTERLSDLFTYKVPDNGFARDPMVLLVQSGADGEVCLPLRGSVKCMVDWGDGQKEYCTGEFGSGAIASGCISHTYKDASAYEVTVGGTVTALSSAGLPASGCLTAVRSWGDIGLLDMSCAFQGQGALTEVAPPGEECFAGVNSFLNAFSGTSITGLPEGFFDSCPAVCDYTRVFSGCLQLEALPDRLFPSAVSLQQCFKDCTSLRTLPAHLCADGAGLRELQETFAGCTAMETIPGSLLSGCSGLERMVSVFAGCSSLTGIPSGLFDDCRAIKVAEGVFMNCSSLAGESPYTMIDGAKVHLYERNAYPVQFAAISSGYLCYFGCSGLSDYGSIPSAWKKP